jgi:hypothetical protein
MYYSVLESKELEQYSGQFKVIFVTVWTRHFANPKKKKITKHSAVAILLQRSIGIDVEIEFLPASNFQLFLFVPFLFCFEICHDSRVKGRVFFPLFCKLKHLELRNKRFIRKIGLKSGFGRTCNKIRW